MSKQGDPSKVDRCQGTAGSDGRQVYTVRDLDEDGTRDTAGKSPVPGPKITWNALTGR
jgi:hypothetical protein